MADPRTPEAVRQRVEALRADLDPVLLLNDMRRLQHELVTLADAAVATTTVSDHAAIDVFLSGLRTAWKQGEVRPTAQPKLKQKRGRRRPDPLVAVTGELKAWFDAEPWQTGRDLLERLQREHPDHYPDSLLRTVQRRLKVWRHDVALRLAFGDSGRAEPARERTPSPLPA